MCIRDRAYLGFRKVNDMIGRVDKLRVRDNITHWKAKTLKLSPILHKAKVLDTDHAFCCVAQDHKLSESIDNKLIEICETAINKNETVSSTLEINNTNRAVGANLSGLVAKKTGETGLPNGSINITFRGSAGNSFGAWLATGIIFTVEGDANDYFGKGLSGGRLIIKPDRDSILVAEQNIIIGNVALYGATGGEAYIRGIGGERFCVRNSAATAVVEGIGDHGCEYMTGGRVVILGETGRNFGAGMSGGIAYVWDPN